jgi:SAM-dependent methyltransferase
MTGSPVEIGSGSVLFGGARLGARLPNPVKGWPDHPEQCGPMTTPADQWAELLQLPPIEGARSLGHAFAICAEIHLHSGLLGICRLRPNGDRAADEWWARPTERPVTVILPVLDPHEFNGVKIRNIAAGGRASQVSLLSLSTYLLETEADDVFIGVQDSQSAVNERTIAAAFDDRGLEILRERWSELPVYAGPRVSSEQLNAGSDAALIEFYDDATQHILFQQTVGGERLIRHWPYAIYLEAFRGKRVLDVGSGFGYDALWFASHGARWTCLDISKSNLDNIKRISALRGLDVTTHYLEDFSSIDRLGSFDVIWCHGSMLNAPVAFAAREARKLLEHLPIGGRWIELAYPKRRWETEGHLPFHRWGERTDGIGTPWMEWYDASKLLERLAPGRFLVYMTFEINESAFNWFDLLRAG